MPALRVDWQAIKGALANVNAPYLFVIPDGARQLFLAIADQLSWEATYRAFGYDYSDWDELQALQSAGVAGLLGGIPLDEIISYIDDVETLLQEIRDKSTCCDDEALYDVISDPDGVVQPVPDETGGDIERGVGDPPGEIETWPEYDVMLCAAAEEFARGLIVWYRWLEAVSDLVNIGLYATLAGLLGGLAGVGVAAAAVGGAIGLIDAFDLLNAIRDFLGVPQPWQAGKDELQDEDVIEQIACAVILSDTPAAAENAVDSALDAYAPNAATGIKLLPLRFILNKVFNAEAGAGGFGGPCFDCTFCFDESTNFGSAFDVRGNWTGGSIPTDRDDQLHIFSDGRATRSWTAGNIPCASKATIVATVARYRTEVAAQWALRAFYVIGTRVEHDVQLSSAIPCCEVATEITITVNLPVEHASSRDWGVELYPPDSAGYAGRLFDARLYFHD